MKNTLSLGGLIVLLLAAVVLVNSAGLKAASSDAVLERGKYLVERVAMCPECHTRRDQSGNLIPSEYLKGAPVPVKAPPYRDVRWAVKAPAIAGLPGYTTEQALRLLIDGLKPDGKPPDPPMPRFRFARPDAKAIVAYLKSLS